ncbi:methyltransferase family protein [Nitrosospira sp. Nsp5]|uniref:Methyltransferase domain-containing protein n=1 Tax=Nitrosospira multiformis TaxID=1231 RepID=A0ABY0T5I7_9PROT|nr:MULTISPECIES: class I SAM-dependent methyltransferase [Nitrosospira]PTR09617.1 methyltransferase family protein [Nitrosospira sp. Nsp5]SDQ26074.1 Methyltransferase domain-containing protein [Nitrosospira multiformis]
MPNENNFYPKFDHDEYAKTRAPDDFWGQIRRTVQGKPVSSDQINMIVDAINSALRMRPDDTLLDLACGNGALSHLFFNSCAEYLGVDLSEYLIWIAKKNFEVLPRYRFVVQGASEYVLQENQPERFSKVLCYGSFSYFSTIDATKVLHTLFEKFSNVQTIFIGNLPDKDRAAEFYKAKQPSTEELSDCSSQIGIWRTRSEFAQLAGNTGWNVKFSTMPAEFYASYYRYDVLLSR